MRVAPPSRSSRASALHAAIACGLVAAILPAQRQPGGSHIRDITGELGFTAEMRDESSKSSNGNSLDQRERLLREIFGLRAMGDIYHPALFDFDAGVELSLDQRDTNAGSGGSNQWSNSVTTYYDARAAILKEKAISGDIYGRRGRLDTRQRFFATTTADSTNLGGNVRFKEIWIPSVLHYEKSSYVGHGLDRLRQNSEEWRLEGSRTGDRTTVDYNLQRNNINQESFNTHYDESVARASLGQRFGAGGVDLFRIGGYYRDQTGDMTSRYEQGDVALHLQWLPEFYSEHELILDRSEIDTTSLSSTQSTTDASSSLHHQLYDSLETGLGGRLVHSEYGSGQSDRAQGDFETTYRKKTSFGLVGGYYHPSLYRQEEIGSNDQVPVLDESHTFQVGVPLLLRFTGAVANTVVVTDATGTLLYAEPTDYVIAVAGPRLRLDIPVGSRITDGSTILVDYIYDPSPDRTYRGLTQDVGVMFEFGDFAAINLDHSSDRIELLSGLDDGTLANTRRNAARARLYQWDQEVTGEYEDYENKNNPYERVQFQAMSRYGLTDDVRVNHGARWYKTRFKNLDGEDRGISLTSSVDWRVAQPTLIFARAEYHKVTYRSDNGHGWMVESGLDYRVRKTTVTLEARYTSERFEIASDQDLLFLQFLFRRFF